jgi:hypothetical protein
MSPLWSDIALAHAARAKVEENSAGGKAKSTEAKRPLPAGRPLRRVLHPKLRTSFAL